MRKMNAVIFDMDGLLLDTEKIALAVFVTSCREFGFKPDTKIYYQCIGTTFPDMKKILREGYGESFPLDAVLELWSRKFHEETDPKPIHLKIGTLELLRYLEKEGIKKAVVTSTRQENALRWLTNAGILHYFDFVLGGDQVTNGKPHPEIYLTACQRLNEEPDCCLALEDSDNGVLSASDAGLTVIQIPDLVQPSAKVRALGHRIVKSLADVESFLSRV
jgi:HAD superfamily hydrolase (TIGR01509 family)